MPRYHTELTADASFFDKAMEEAAQKSITAAVQSGMKPDAPAGNASTDTAVMPSKCSTPTN